LKDRDDRQQQRRADDGEFDRRHGFPFVEKLARGCGLGPRTGMHGPAR